MECITIKTDYDILSSLVKIPELCKYAKDNNINTLGIIDNNLSSSAEFYSECCKNNIKPVIGLDVTINDMHIYIYAKNEDGFKKLLKLNSFIIDNEPTIINIAKFINNNIILLPYESKILYQELKSITNDIFIGYKTEEEQKNAIIITNNICFCNLALSIKKDDTKYINYLNMIKNNQNVDNYKFINYDFNYLILGDTSKISDLISLKFTVNDNLIPHYNDNITDSYRFLESLSIKGLNKRLNNKIPNIYKERLLYELKIIKEMGFVDYFLIVYDYVKYAKNHNILVGPGRGSAAGSLVTYSLGITNVDPIKYNLLFERFLNPERVTMPDIDIDFDSSKREEVIHYVKERYGHYNAMPIMTYGTMASKQVLLSLSKILNIQIDEINQYIDPKKSLKDNLTPDLIKILNNNKELKNIYHEALKIEGLKKHISTHAAGIVICNQNLDNIIPIIKSGSSYLTGYTMNYLENLGLLKMDFLAIKDLTTISTILKNINNNVNLNQIDLNDQEVIQRFTTGNTIGIFQFESEGMKNFLRKLKPTSFNDLTVALALFRPGPMDNIDSFIKRKEGKEKIDYITDALKPVLSNTYGIIIYQEQIMQIFTIIAGYSRGEADLIRRAISKKKEDIILNEKNKFIEKALINGYPKEISNKIYDLIIKFANYGFNKSHSVAYAMVGYQMMYLKVKYPLEFYSSLLTINIGSSSKTKEYIDEAKLIGIEFIKPDINRSKKEYYIVDNKIQMPFCIIKNIGYEAANDIEIERTKGNYKDLFDFYKRLYGKNINIKIIQNLIKSGCLDSFNETRQTLIENIKSADIFAELASGLESELVSVPELERFDEYSQNDLMNDELELFGFYVSNHPASKYSGIKLNQIKEYFDKNIITHVLLEDIRSIKTKKGDTMAFLKASDETGIVDYTLFPNRIGYINEIQKGDILKILGHVEKRLDKYQIVVNRIEKMK